MFTSVFPEKVIEVRYEDLVREPSVIREICDFLNVGCRPSLTEKTDHFNEIDEVKGRSHHQNLFQPVSTEHIGKGRGALDEQARRGLNNLIGADLQRLGYDPLL